MPRKYDRTPDHRALQAPSEPQARAPDTGSDFLLRNVQHSLFRTIGGQSAKKRAFSEPSQILPSLRLRVDLHAEPLDVVEAVMDAEDALGKETGSPRQLTAEQDRMLCDGDVDMTVGELSARLRQLLV